MSDWTADANAVAALVSSARVPLRAQKRTEQQRGHDQMVSPALAGYAKAQQHELTAAYRSFRALAVNRAAEAFAQQIPRLAELLAKVGARLDCQPQHTDRVLGEFLGYSADELTGTLSRICR